MRNALRLINGILALPFIVVVWIYQRTLSPDHGLMKVFFPYGACRHAPTCSMYAIDELRRSYLPMAIWRIIRRTASCHPWKKLSDEKLREVIQNV